MDFETIKFMKITPYTHGIDIVFIFQCPKCQFKKRIQHHITYSLPQFYSNISCSNCKNAKHINLLHETINKLVSMVPQSVGKEVLL